MSDDLHQMPLYDALAAVGVEEPMPELAEFLGEVAGK